ncbi:MAG: NADH-quinone oxidoreductase subunit H [Deltaproteobacteria bacterium]|nr:NADH-quinone oxidoreductase subunit H [Deltaproteobacteria bacterium]
MFLVVSTLIKLVVFALVFALGLAAILTWMERRQSAYSQDRLGPTRAHFFKLFGRPFVLFGLLHIVADALKMFFKEPFIPKDADRGIFRVAPLIGFCTSLVILALVPFGPDLVTERWGVIPLQVARIDAGLLLVLAVGSLGVYGVALAGWASNNRFALLGGMRASAQSVSYEIALGLTIVGVLIAYGSTELSAIVNAQRGLVHGFLPNWGIFIQPFAAVLFFVAATAETKRAPFDLPEGESEIIGYFLEYSSMGFGMFMLGEFIEIVVLSCVFVTLFLGGWQLPYLIGDTSSSFLFGSLFGVNNSVAHALDGMLVFGIKVFFMCAFQLQVRWTLPRFRYDQLMRLGWKTLLPLALANIFATALLTWWDPTLKILGHVGVAMILMFVLVVVAGPRRVPAESHGH